MRLAAGLAVICVACLLGTPLHGEQAGGPKGGPPEFKALKYRLLGPAAGGRVSRVAGVSGNPLVYYAATASGGVWKSADGGITWKPIFDDQPIASIGSIAVSPSDPNVVYVGSGEANIRGNVAPGNGIYKSTDAGKSWKHVWKQEGQIGTMVVHPANPDIAYAAVLGHAFGPNPERGVYRTMDGGKTWQRVLYKNPDTGASDVCLDPSNPRILFAGFWQARRRPWELTSGGPGSGLYTSRDGGDSWVQLMNREDKAAGPGKGLPDGIWGKVGVAVAPSDGRRVYALIEAEAGGLYRSDDGGETWQLANGGRYLRQRAWYFSTLTIDPANPDIVWCPQVPMLRSIDGGKTFKRVKGLHHVDHHDLWIDPRNPRRMISANDGGVDVSVNGGEEWYAPPLPIAQFYHVAVDNDTPYRVSGAMQDLGTACAPSHSLAAAGITQADWFEIGGGEAGHTAHDPANPNIVYAGEYGGIFTRYDHRTRRSRNMSIYPFNPSGHGAENLHYRFQWTAPIVVSPHNSKVVYHAGNVLFRTSDGGLTWAAISPDLTRNDKSKQKWSGGPITGDNTGAEVYCTIFALAESPLQKDLIWAGTDDGLVHRTTDGGKTWTQVTANIPGIPEWGTVKCIEPSAFDAGTAYMVVDAHRLDDMRPYLFKTSDYGRTWKSLSAGLPSDVYLHAVREDPQRHGLLFVGSEKGVAYSPDDGKTWKQLKLNLPTVAVHDLRVKNSDLVVGTHGRSIWILDDITPLRELSAEAAGQPAHLFPIRHTIQWDLHSSGFAKKVGDNPPAGAVIHYHLAAKPKAPISIEIRDQAGTLIQQYASKPPAKKLAAGAAKPAAPEEVPEDDPDAPFRSYKKPELPTETGVQRVVWDLRHKGANKIAGAKIDMGSIEVGPPVLPGTYQVRLIADGKTLAQSVVVQADPRNPLPRKDLEAHLQFALAIRDDLNRVSAMVKEIQSIRKQIQTRSLLLAEDPRCAKLTQAGDELVRKLDSLEEKLHNPKAQVAYDILAQPGGAKLYSQLGFLYEDAKSQGLPTQGQREVFAARRQELQSLTVEFQRLIGKDVVRVNEIARQLAVPNVITAEPHLKTKSEQTAGAMP